LLLPKVLIASFRDEGFWQNLLHVFEEHNSFLCLFVDASRLAGKNNQGVAADLARNYVESEQMTKIHEAWQHGIKNSIT
jgi:hypothetical protein